MGDRNKPFGGFCIVFASDLCQLEPSGASGKTLHLSSQSSSVWNNTINVVIILNNDHRFKEDPEYEQITNKCGRMIYRKQARNS